MLTATQLIENCLLWLRDPHSNFHKQNMMLLYVNRSLKDIAERSQSITGWMFSPVVKGIFRYPLPDTFLKALIVGFKTEQFGWRELDLRKDGTVDGISQSLHIDTNQIYPAFYSIAGRSVIEKFIGIVATDEAGISGGHVFTLTDAPITLFHGFVKQGDRLLNVTDGSEAEITGVNLTDQLLYSGTLGGGIDNQLEVDDEVRIVSEHAVLHTINLAPPPPYDSDMGEEPLSLFLARSHRAITQTDIDNDNDGLELDLELQPALENRVCYYGSLARYDIDDRRTQLFLGLYESEYRKAAPKVMKRVRQESTQWRKGIRTRSYQGTILNPPTYGNPYASLVIR